MRRRHQRSGLTGFRLSASSISWRLLHYFQAGTAITSLLSFGKRVVRIAIEPALTRLRRCDNRMPVARACFVA